MARGAWRSKPWGPWRSNGGFEWEKHGKTMGIYNGNIMDSGDLTPRNGNIKWEYKN